MHRLTALYLGLGILYGCAARSPSPSARPPAGEQATVHITVQNYRLAGPAVAFVYWDGGPPVYLGRLDTGSEGTFTTPLSGEKAEVRCGPESGPRHPRPSRFTQEWLEIEDVIATPQVCFGPVRE